MNIRRFLIILTVLMSLGLHMGCHAQKSGPFPGMEAVYLRPEPLSTESAETFMSNMKKWGAKEVFLEAGYDNGVLNHSKVFPAMDPETDWLKILVDSAKKEGLKVHVWIKICFWVHKKENLESFPILKAHPEYIDVNRAGQMVSDAGNYEEQNFIFVNPAVPGVLEAEHAFIRELCAYDIDGISIDYIRFKAARKDAATWFGYNPVSVKKFRDETGLDPHGIEKDLTPGSDFMKWTKYNEAVIENCVASIHGLVQEINREEGKKILLSASPFSAYRSGESPKYQNWSSWDERGLIDLWLPMCMSLDMAGLEKEVRGVMTQGLKAPYYPVIYPNQHGSLHPPVKPHYDVLKKCGIEKFAVFSYKQLKEEFPEKR